MSIILIEILYSIWSKIKFSRNHKTNQEPVFGTEKWWLENSVTTKFYLPDSIISSTENDVLIDHKVEKFQISEYLENDENIIDFTNFHFPIEQSLSHCNSFPKVEQSAFNIIRGISSPYIYGFDESKMEDFDGLYCNLQKIQEELNKIKFDLLSYSKRCQKLALEIDIFSGHFESSDLPHLIQQLKWINYHTSRSLEVEAEIQSMYQNFSTYYGEEISVSDYDCNNNRWSLDFDL